MKKQYNNPAFTKIDIDTKDIMSLSSLLTSDSDNVDGDGNFINRDTFSWNW